MISLEPSYFETITRAAVDFHVRMSGFAVINEGFLRDWFAVNIHREGGYVVNIEVTSTQFRNWYNVSEPLKDGRIDAIISEPKDNPNDASPLAIIEFKMANQLRKIESDIRRTSRLLTLLPGVAGYQVICTTDDSWDSQIRVDKAANDVCGLAARLHPHCEPAAQFRIFSVKFPENRLVWFASVIITVFPFQ